MAAISGNGPRANSILIQTVKKNLNFSPNFLPPPGRDKQIESNTSSLPELSALKSDIQGRVKGVQDLNKKNSAIENVPMVVWVSAAVIGGIFLLKK